MPYEEHTQAHGCLSRERLFFFSFFPPHQLDQSQLITRSFELRTQRIKALSVDASMIYCDCNDKYHTFVRVSLLVCIIRCMCTTHTPFIGGCVCLCM